MSSTEAPNPSTVWTDGREHWVDKGGVRLFMWEKPRRAGTAYAGTILFVHGSSMASQPTFDLHVPGRPDSSVMSWFAERGFDTWTLDNEGYGRSGKQRAINCGIENGAEDLAVASAYILSSRSGSAGRLEPPRGAGRATGPARGALNHIGADKKLMLYGISSGALKAALFAQNHPERVARLALDAFVWTGEGSPTLQERAKRLPEFRKINRRPIDRPFVRSIFSRDHAGCADERTVEAFADAILSLDDSMPTGTYVDMTSKLPMIDPSKLTVPTLVLRGEYDGIASFDDLIRFFALLPNMDKQFSVLRGISHASFQQKNYLMVYHLLHAFFTQPEPLYKGE